MSLAFQLVLAFSLLVQAPKPAFVKIGNAAEQISDDQNAFPSRGDKKPWLVNAEMRQAGMGVELYYPAEMTSEKIRRGKMFEWGGREYAFGQVALDGRDWDVIRDEWDILRPFLIEGKFEDAELLRLVQFIRGRPKNQADGILPDKPIRRIRRADILERTFEDRGIVLPAADMIVVELFAGGTETRLICLQRQGESWVVVRIGRSIA